MREKISACVTTFNEEHNVERCLRSLDWCDEIVVVDSFSRDRTVELCKQFTARVYQHEWLGYIGQKNLIRGLGQSSLGAFCGRGRGGLARAEVGDPGRAAPARRPHRGL
jgi:glycosyltransferase involved in cell wall biosynthesis